MNFLGKGLGIFVPSNEMGADDTAPANFWGDMPEEEYYSSQGVKNTKEYFKTPHGTIFTQEFRPVGEKAKAIVCLTHGYGSDTGWMFQLIAIEMAKWGYVAYAADMLGHGRSEGIRCYTPEAEKVKGIICAQLILFPSNQISSPINPSLVNKAFPIHLSALAILSHRLGFLRLLDIRG